MKKIFSLLLIALALASCASSRNGCPGQNYKNIQRHDAKPFKVIKMKSIGDGHWYVVARRFGDVRQCIFECKPDTTCGVVWL